MDTYAGFENNLKNIKDKHLLRSLNQITSRQRKYIHINNRNCLNLSSNDYLGLATDKTLIQNFYKGMDESNLIDDFGLGSSSSRLLAGNFRLYSTLESYLENLYQCKSVLVFNSGYHANLGMIPVLAQEGDLILSDSLNHASIVDGIRLSKARCQIFKHNDMESLESILKRVRSRFQRVLIITESVFSMDGDLADLEELVRIKSEYDALLYVDEAHSVGVYGEQGLGLCEETGTIGKIDVMLGTMGKALASHGAYAVTKQVVKELLVNQMRSLLYTTALPPVAINWNLYVMTHLKNFGKQRHQLKKVSALFKQALIKEGLMTPGDSHIIPVLTYENENAVRLSQILQEAGFLAYPIRPPTVPKDQSRIRISLTADMEFDDIKDLPKLIKQELDKKR